MSLIPYRRKRNFRRTPEPSGHRFQADGALHFVVQKHDASHLHYDFRLENRGVLKSWAVPKGVSTDPKIRRLAIEVEDHPFDYRHFEGIIPEGNYGAGTVMIWDEGEYYADSNLSKDENERKIEEALRKGHLTFYLNGKKLKGLYTLVRLHGEDGKKPQWFLIKKADDFAGKPIDREDLSATTGRTLDEIGGEVPPQKRKTLKDKTVKAPASSISSQKDILKDLQVKDAPKAELPAAINPMLATLASKPFDGNEWMYEVKWDGYRILAHRCGGQVSLYTRNNKDYTENFPEAVAGLRKIPFDVVFDGEMVAVDERGISQFQLLQNYMRNKEGRLIYYVFDILSLEGHDLHRWPLWRRRAILERILPPATEYVRLSQSIIGEGKAFFKAAKAHGLEGIIAKHRDSTYEYGRRSLQWIKIKAIAEQEAVICGFTAPKGGRKFFGALILGVYDNDGLRYIGHTGGGFDYDSLKDMFERLKPLITPKCPFAVKPKTNAPVTWVMPRLTCEVKFQEWTNDGHMRQPIFLGLREDKKPQEVGKETPAPTEQILKTPKPDAAQSAGRLKLTHLDKVYWPKEGYTKGDMIDYYRRIMPYIFPYLKGRPHVLRRHPNGIQAGEFFQKDLVTKPEWIKTAPIHSDSKELIRYLICEKEDDVLYMCNLGCIELSPWPSTIERVDYPDYLVLDFDPVKIDFAALIDVVLTSHRILKKAGVPCFCKTSGGRGLHIYIPLAKKYTYEQTKNFAHVLCMVINRAMPDVTSLERSPQKRQRRVYLDYLQNHYGATMASAYSLRPREGAAVSAPLDWKEVNKSLNPVEFNIRTMSSRLKRKGDLWKGVLGAGIDIAKILRVLKF